MSKITTPVGPAPSRKDTALSEKEQFFVENAKTLNRIEQIEQLIGEIKKDLIKLKK